MNKPDGSRHNPDPRYLRQLIERAGVSQERAASILNISPRQMRYYLALSEEQHQAAPYCVQFALEILAQPERNHS